MLYDPSTRTMIEVVGPGVPVAEARFGALASMLGHATDDGRPIECVALVFVGGRDEAASHLDSIKRFGLECRAIDAGIEVTLHPGSRAIRAPASAGTLLPILREAAWPHVASTLHRRLVAGGPWVTFGIDASDRVMRLGPQHANGRSLDDIEAEAVANLARRGFEPLPLEDAIVALPGEYSSEAILVPDVMMQCARAVGCELIAVAVPCESRLIATRADDAPRVANLVAWSRQMFDGARSRRISPMPFLVRDGKVVGCVNTGDLRFS